MCLASLKILLVSVNLLGTMVITLGFILTIVLGNLRLPMRSIRFIYVVFLLFYILCLVSLLQSFAIERQLVLELLIYKSISAVSEWVRQSSINIQISESQLGLTSRQCWS